MRRHILPTTFINGMQSGQRKYSPSSVAADERYQHASPGVAVVPTLSCPAPQVAMAKPPITPRELVERLDARHDELIAKLDELNAQIEAALAEFGRSRQTPPQVSADAVLPKAA